MRGIKFKHKILTEISPDTPNVRTHLQFVSE